MYSLWDPRSEMASLQGRLNRFFDTQAKGINRDEIEDAAFAPPIDVVEKEEALIVQAELPGVAREDIEINVEDNRLFLRGEKRPPKDNKDEEYRRAERPYGRFARTFTLSRGYDAQKMSALLKDGVLEMRIPRSEQAPPRKIQVS